MWWVPIPIAVLVTLGTLSEPRATGTVAVGSSHVLKRWVLHVMFESALFGRPRTIDLDPELQWRRAALAHRD
jgi:hypothetical protein